MERHPEILSRLVSLGFVAALLASSTGCLVAGDGHPPTGGDSGEPFDTGGGGDSTVDCSPPDSTGGTDSGSGTDSGVPPDGGGGPREMPDTGHDGSLEVTSGVVPDNPGDGPDVATACSGDDDCLAEDPSARCSTSVFGEVFSPTPYCVTTGCTLGSGAVDLCNANRGLCIDVGGRATCLHRCTIPLDGSRSEGCPGNDGCTLYPTGSDGSALGYCFGGCDADADCPGGGRCNHAFGVCLGSSPDEPAFETKSIGEPCTRDDLERGVCNCVVGRAPGAVGYCTNACRVGVLHECPSGFACDAVLPAAYTVAPVGLNGRCLATCATADDCAARGNLECTTSGGMALATCKP